MKSRMEKYYDNHDSAVSSRISKNESLYKEINNIDVNEYNPNNNVKVIGDNDNVIDVDKIKNLLEKNYKQENKRTSLRLEHPSEIEEVPEDTKEYNINSILQKAREEKQLDYDKDRLKKLRDTQFDILNSLNLEKKEEDNSKKEKERELMDLINTITSKELENNIKEEVENLSDDPLDLFADLKGSENTQVLSGIEEEIKKSETRQLIEKEINETKANSFYTTSNIFTQSDFDDFNDLKSEMKATTLIIKILVVFVVIAFLIGMIIFINNYFNLNLF